MINENQLPCQDNFHLKDEATLAIIRVYLENNLSDEEVVSKTALTTSICSINGSVNTLKSRYLYPNPKKIT